MLFNINTSYTFNTLAAAQLGATLTNVKVIGIVMLEEATKYGDVVTQHQELVNVISGLPPTPNTLTFIIFKDSSGNQFVLANEYIDQATIVAVTTVDLTINIYAVDSGMQATITARLRELGVTNFKVMAVVV